MSTASNVALTLTLTLTAFTRTSSSRTAPAWVHLNKPSRSRATTSSSIHRGLFSIRGLSAAADSHRLEESVKKTVADNPVVVYSKTWCPYSIQVKSLFSQLGVRPLVIELDELGAQGPKIQDVLERITGQHTVPNVFIGGRHIGGCSDTNCDIYWPKTLTRQLIHIVEIENAPK